MQFSLSLRGRATLVLTLLSSLAPLTLADDQPSPIQRSMQAGEASYRKADYETARASYERGWQLAQDTPGNNPARYDILKRLPAIRASLGQYAERGSNG